MKIFLSLITITLFLPSFVQAQIPTLVDLVPANAGEGIGGYINTLYAMSIGVAALLAVIKIIIAGVKYMVTDVVTTKGTALEDIRGALLGLLLILSAVLILGEINPRLRSTSVDFEVITTPKEASPPALRPTSSGGQAITPPQTGSKDLIPSLDLSRVPRGEEQEAFTKFRSDCRAAGGVPTIRVSGGVFRDCKEVITSTNPTEAAPAPAQNPTQSSSPAPAFSVPPTTSGCPPGTLVCPGG